MSEDAFGLSLTVPLLLSSRPYNLAQTLVCGRVPFPLQPGVRRQGQCLTAPGSWRKSGHMVYYTGGLRGSTHLVTVLLPSRGQR